MLCNNTDDAQDAQQQHPKPFLLHPHDPCVEKEYETLIRAWKHQLIDNTPTTPNNDYVRFAWMRLMDHYLDQQWLDSKQMLQCAQAWSARDELSLTEAVHTMNILSLKSMQRSLDARQELLQALGDPDLMAGFGVSPINTTQQQRFSSASSLTGSEEDVHAPLLVKHNTTPTEENFSLNNDEAIITTEDTVKTENEYDNSEYFDSELIDLSDKEDVNDDVAEEEEIKARHVFEEEEEEEDQVSPLASRIYNRSSMTSSMSSPNISSIDHYSGFTTRKYESYYQTLHQASSWKKIEMKNNNNDDLLSENGSSSSISSSHNSEISSPLLGSSVQWKSWFLGEQQQPDDQITFTEEFADEKVETDASFAEFHPEYIKKQQPFLMVRSESSISAFRPISNNLAPRCQNHTRSSSSSQEENLLLMPPTTTTTTSATITKSRSFPTKAALSASIKKPFVSSPPPPPAPHQHQKEQQRNFMIRSIVSKKVSLSKLFGSKKSSSSSHTTS